MTMVRTITSRSGRIWHLATSITDDFRPCICIPMDQIDGLSDEQIGHLVRTSIPQLQQLLIDEQEYFEQCRLAEQVPRSRKPIAGFVYLIRHQGIYKIGRTKDLKQRLKAFNHQYIDGVELIHSIACLDIIQYEARLHKQYAEYQIKGEWFDLPANAVEAICALQSEVE